MTKKKTSTTASVGKMIKKARIDKKLSPEIIANETGCSVDLLKKIESGKQTPSVSSLLQIARALDLDSGFFFKEQEVAQKDRVKAYTNRTENYAYKTLTPGAERKHLKAFRVMIESMSAHSGVGYNHEGEEFVYVLSGKVKIMVGEHKNVLKRDDSLHFNSGIKHQITNIGKEKAELLVTIYSP